MRALVHQAARYVTVGGLATATDVAVAIALNSLLAWPALAANTVAFAAAFTVSYFGNLRLDLRLGRRPCSPGAALPSRHPAGVRSEPDSACTACTAFSNCPSGWPSFQPSR